MAERAARLGERLAQGYFHLSILGEFNRGKSTLVNALLGQEVLSMGALPVTAVATELTYRRPGAVVVHLGGIAVDLGSEVEVADYATEAGNPAKARKVARVEIRVPFWFLQAGLVLVDTPWSRLHPATRRRGRTGRPVRRRRGHRRALCGRPRSEPERRLVATLSDRQGPMFFVLNPWKAHGMGRWRGPGSAAVSGLVGPPPGLASVASGADRWRSR
ncbi:MAG TPA: dynamin family protein [Acidimicrobiales bacterium]|nr:dynamin family protein [Acidimicrobiales bacterium]